MKLNNGDVYIDKDGDLCIVYTNRENSDDHLLIFLTRSEKLVTYEHLSSTYNVETHLKNSTNGKPIMNILSIFKAVLESYHASH